MNESIEVKIKEFVKNFLEKSKDKKIEVISHFDTDGITSAAIIIKTLKKLDKEFSLRVEKSFTKETIESLDKEKINLILDLGSGNLEELGSSTLENIFIIDHHETVVEIPNKIQIINPELHNKEKISASGLCYLFSKEIDKENISLAKLGILGMIGDSLGGEISKLNNGILEDGEIVKKRGLLIYPATRPLNKALEYSHDPYIPGVTGDFKGTLDFLEETGIKPNSKKYKNLADLTEEEMEKVVTSIILRNPTKNHEDLVGDLFLLKFYGKLEDARELSAKINAVSRNGNPQTALMFCLEDQKTKKDVDSIHTKYKQQLISAIKEAESQEKIKGETYEIINAKDKIKDTMIGTVISILSNNKNYKKGTILIGMSYDQKENIKISARLAGRIGQNLRELLSKVMENFEGEVGGHKLAAGCLIKKDDEEKFVESLKKHLEIQVIKVEERS